MKQKSILLILGITICLAFVTGFLSKNSNNTFKNQNVIYALTVDGMSQDSIPDKGPYKVTAECSNAICEWDYKNWELSVIEEGVNSKIKCSISFETIKKDYLNEKIINSEGNFGYGWWILQETFTFNSVSYDAGYRYGGNNPNNYVWFNNELWRIIGVIDEKTHGQNDDETTEIRENQLVKLIRSDSIGGLAWDKNNVNDWKNSSLYKLFNPVSGDANSGAYYNKKNGNNSGYCYSSESTTGNCDYSNIGIDSYYRKMVKEVIWKVGGMPTEQYSSQTFYASERLNSSYNNSRDTEVTGYIGLIYPSDYAFSVNSINCPRTKELNQYGSSSCAGSSWLFGKGKEWTLVPGSSYAYPVYGLNSFGSLGSYSSNSGLIVRPSLYLNASVYVINGTGSEADPYIIGMD